ncbi:hypothetical protein WICPIJ_004195 [Wickerhamomyces pijperi]|uniref:Actin-like ATPase domain-containing protein n=1 Tax=Wickerhamomyces pijperi TaxID=599730 RepID=A0A9P8Q5S3_WICPI|nr:hypothetical protein WICPIJ_004195 [Wickerhamomyces pijperi]
MAPFIEEHYFIVCPGSSTTNIKFGVGESFLPAELEIPTKVYSTADAGVFKSQGAESDAIYPIVDGVIVDIAAFNFFLKLIYKSILKQHPNISNIPFLLVSSTQWRKNDIESITQYVFESMEVNSFAIVPEALATLFSYGSQPNAVVVNIGKCKTEINIIVDYSLVKHASKVIPYGGDSISKKLSTLLPNLSAAQIECLKKSEIYEVLSDEDKKLSFFGIDGLSNDSSDVLDVASIIASGKTQEFIDKKTHSDGETPNSKLQTNTFTDSDKNTLTVGRERFQGTDELISQISSAIYASLETIDDLVKRQECYDHIILNGNTTKIAGFNEAVNTKIIDEFLVGKEYQQSAAQAAFQTFSTTSIQFEQLPKSIKFEKMPEYFTEWKKYGFHDVTLLGAQILAKFIFGGHNDQMFITRSAYNDKGPLAVWDICF